MPLGGGTFISYNKTLPGAYINFVSASTTAAMGERGTATLPLALTWGPEKEIIRLEAAEFNKQAQKVLGYSPTAPELLPIRETLKRATALLLYRINSGGGKAEVTIGGLIARAKYSGSRGNALRLVIQVNIDDEALYDVATYLETTAVDLQTVAEAKQLVTNDYIEFSGDDFEITAGVSLSGGTDGAVTGGAYADYLTAIEVETFNVIGYPGTDNATKSLFASFVKRLRENEGYKVVGVIANYPADYEGIISVKNGVILNTGEKLTANQAVAWVTGATAGATVAQSLTESVYEDAVDVDVKYTKSQYEQAVKAGEFVFYPDAGKVRVLSDVNSLTTFTPTKSADFASNRVMRVLDGWAQDVARIFGQSYIGKITNNETGRTLFKADLVTLAGEYQRVEAISDFTPDDLDIRQGPGKKDVLVDTALTPNDSMEKLYMGVLVR